MSDTTRPANMPDVKDQMLRVRVDERDRERLARLSTHHELPEAAVIRLLIKQAADALELDKPKKKPKPTK